MYLLCMSHIHAFSHAYVLYFSIYTCYLIYFGAFLIASFFPLSILFTLVISMVLKRKSTPAWNPLHFDAFFSSDHAPLFLSVFVMMMPTRHLRKTFSNLAFIRNAESFYWHWLSHCHSQSGMGVSLWRTYHLSSRADLRVLLQHARDWPLRTSFCYLCHTTGISIPITPQLVTNVLRVPRIEFPDYSSCERLRIVSEDQLMSTFCERPSVGWAPVHLLLRLCKRPAVSEYGDDLCTLSFLTLQLYYEVSCSLLVILSWASYHWLPLPLYFVFDRCISGFSVPW